MKIKQIYWVLGIACVAIQLSCGKQSQEKRAENLTAPAAVMEMDGNQLLEEKAEGKMLYNANAGSSNDQISEPTKPSQEPNPAIAIGSKKKIIKDGSLSIENKDLGSAKKEMDALLKKYNAYYNREDFTSSEARLTFNLVVRIPAENFENFVLGLESGKGEIISKSITARDVTSEYLDVSIRLNSKRSYLSKYLTLLNQAKSIKDILQLQENIRVLEEEIESSVGQLKYLDDQVAYSTLNIELYQTKDFVYKPEEKQSFWELTKKSLNQGWQLTTNLFLGLIQIWPLLIVGIFLVIWFRKRKKKTPKV